MNIRPILLGAVAALVVLGAAAGCQSEPEPIKIGVIVALSGPFPEGGQNLLNGIELAVDEVNARGGVNGRPLEIVVEDGAFDTDIETQAFLSIEESTEPLFYITVLNTLSEGIPDLAQESEVVLLQAVLADYFKAEEWIFQYGLDIKNQNEPIFELLNRLDVEKLGVLYPESEWTADGINRLEETFEAQGKTLESYSFVHGQPDYTHQIQALEGTDAMYFIGANQDVPLMVEQARAAGYTGHILTVPPYYQAVPFALPPGEVVYLGAPAIYNPNFLFAQEAAERYRDRYAGPFNLNAGFGYDVIHLMSDLLEGESLTRLDVKNVLDQGFSYNGVYGDVDMSPGAHHMPFSLFPARILDGKLEFLE